MRAIAIDLGGSHATCGLIEDTRIVSKVSLELHAAAGLRSVLPALASVVGKLRAQAPGQDCEGLALGFCGLVDSRCGRVLSTNGKWDDAPDIDLSAWCRSECGLGFRIENDARMALLGERFAGAARGSDDAVMMTFGTGIGAAAMMGGRLVRGRHFQAGCLGGHLPVSFDGRLCACGNLGCAEAEASTWALPAICRSWPGFESSLLSRESRLDFAALFRVAHEGDRAAEAVLDRCLRVWAANAVALVHAYDPEVLVLGGGVAVRQQSVIDFIGEHVSKYAWTPWGKVQVRAAALGADAALLGAVPLLTEEF